MLNAIKAVIILFSPNRSVYQSFNNLIGFYPTNLKLYQKAFRHKSAALAEDLPSNERLEYLGDAIFGAVVAHFLFQRFPFRDEGFLTKMRSKIVSREYLNNLALKVGIDVFVKKSQDRKSTYKSVYGDAFEALIGAIYLDKGYDFTKEFILNRIVKYYVDIEELEKVDPDFKSKLINYCQKEKKKFIFKTEEESGPANEKLFKVVALIEQVVMGRGADSSKKRAEQKAAEEACKELNII